MYLKVKLFMLPRIALGAHKVQEWFCIACGSKIHTEQRAGILAMVPVGLLRSYSETRQGEMCQANHFAEDVEDNFSDHFLQPTFVES